VALGGGPFRSMCAVPNTAVFCSSLILCFPGMFFRYFLNDIEMGKGAAGHHFCFYIPRALNLHCKVFIFWNFLCFFLDHISDSINCTVY